MTDEKLAKIERMVQDSADFNMDAMRMLVEEVRRLQAKNASLVAELKQLRSGFAEEPRD